MPVKVGVIGVGHLGQHHARLFASMDGARLIGASRAITDGEYHGLIYDVAVLPEYQGRGIGQSMLQQLLERLPVWRVMLVADEEVQGFYRKAGFEGYPGVMARLDWNRLTDAASDRLRAPELEGAPSQTPEDPAP